ncbi:hypothetical protein DSM112329_00308 [Paraconexibacter sp. AEG42_29]|uniref:Branched-chain amino acid ABC transporter permease n=1 Tax=Paraconexibacter sp. AEG42_29 TaxID=2997339 RepID=A0AAU7APE3_9ACTN
MSRSQSRIVGLVVVAMLLAVPYFLEEFWLQMGLFAMAAAIAAIGLTLLSGVAGQLSLAHAFYIAVGAYGYCYLAGDSGSDPGLDLPSGLNLPPVLALIGAVLLAGVAGALFSPIAGRLRGIYLGLASIGLVFVGQHILRAASGVTGGFNGRDAEPFSVLGFTFDATPMNVLGVEYHQLEKLWYLGLLFVAAGAWYAHSILGSRPGRALEAIRDSEVAAAVMGVNVPVYRGAAFVVSSMYAGLGGVFIALAYQRIVPDTFGFLYSLDFVVMIVLGGVASVRGAIVGAAVVICLPQLLDHYATSLPLVAAAGDDGLQPTDASRFLYGGAVVAVLIFSPGGLAGLARRLSPRHTKESTA